jgi:hypothetical protein
MAKTMAKPQVQAPGRKQRRDAATSLAHQARFQESMADQLETRDIDKNNPSNSQ